MVLLDLWAGRSRTTVFADQTWIGFAGSRPPEPVERVWRTVRQARDAAVDTVRRAAAERRPIAGFEADRAARAVVESAGFGPAFVHRTGHSIDRDLHGSGPHLDDYETHDERLLIPGVGFSVEPGIYLAGRVRDQKRGKRVLGRAGPRGDATGAAGGADSGWELGGGRRGKVVGSIPRFPRPPVPSSPLTKVRSAH